MTLVVDDEVRLVNITVAERQALSDFVDQINADGQTLEF